MATGNWKGKAARRWASRYFRCGLALAGALTAVTPTLAQQPGAPANSESAGKWGASLDLEGKLGTGRKLGEADLFLPLAQDESTLLFGDVRTRFDDADSREGNFGLGVRQMFGGGWNLGAYGYFDRRRSPYGHTFDQLTFGAEALGRDLDVRVNSYWPIGETAKPVDNLSTATLYGTKVIFRGGEEKALRGFDAELGWRVPVFAVEGPIDLRVYAGVFTFDAGDVLDMPNVTGSRLRAELVGYDLPELGAGTRVTLGAEWQHDEARGSQGLLSFRLRIPLQSEMQRSRRLTAQERRMTAPIVRDVDVVTEAGAFGAPEIVTQTADGSPITVLSSASTTGANLPTAVTAAGANSTVILRGSFTTNSNATGIVTLSSGQTLMGAGNLSVRAPSGRTAVLTTPTATITGNVGSTNSTVMMANNSTLTGMTVNNTDATSWNAGGVLATGVSGARITNNTITATQTGFGTAHALDILSSASNVMVSGNTLTAVSPNSFVALALQVGSSSATVTRNTLSATGLAPSFANHTRLNNANILTGSSGNTVKAGSCSVVAAGSGTTVTYTNAAACGP